MDSLVIESSLDHKKFHTSSGLHTENSVPSRNPTVIKENDIILGCRTVGIMHVF